MSERREAGPHARSRGAAGKPAPGYAMFVARSTYRKRRMIDAAGLLPILGAILFALPLLWLDVDGGAPRTSDVMIYLFAVWGVLAFLSARITRGLRSDEESDEDEGPSSSEEEPKQPGAAPLRRSD